MNYHESLWFLELKMFFKYTQINKQNNLICCVQNVVGKCRFQKQQERILDIP